MEQLLKDHSNSKNIVVRRSLNDKEENVLFFSRIGKILKLNNCIILYGYDGEFQASIPDSYIITVSN